jgi:histidyl-tRNA synthetase
MEIKLDSSYKGTRILFGETARRKREILSSMIGILTNSKYEEIMIPIIQYQSIFESKVGEENNNMMFNFTDNGGRPICLSPEYTAVIQELVKGPFKYQKDVTLFYIQECFRGEKPQKGRYRQFTQLGVEVLNPTVYNIEDMIELACRLLTDNDIVGYNVNREVKRGLDYYKNGQGFEITYEGLGAQKQIVGGGEYEGGVGFAIGIDRLLAI